MEILKLRVHLINMSTFKKFTFPNQTNYYQGKVRDVYTIKDKYLVMVVSNRISAFDVILPEPIPYKGQVLNQIAAHFLDATKDIVPNWVLNVPDATATVGLKCNPFKIEMVIRGYLAGHAWREYQLGKRSICGVSLPDGLNENDRLPSPIITPTTKAEEGHDEDISREDIIKQGIVGEADYEQLERYTFALFARGAEMADKRNLILVDTKYEFGKIGDKVMLMDEIHTPDSSRYFYKEGYQERQNKKEPQRQLSKEFVRQWLIENDFQGKTGQQIPLMTTQKITEISKRYIELYEQIVGKTFIPIVDADPATRIETNVNSILATLK